MSARIRPLCTVVLLLLLPLWPISTAYADPSPAPNTSASAQATEEPRAGSHAGEGRERPGRADPPPEPAVTKPPA
ncbi:hypothetical protein P8605_24420, partial [Streptomyces sp. T-3]|nr:hypothetical protein [Streptomyces sp. T-3]